MIQYVIILLPILYQIKSPFSFISLGELISIPMLLCNLIENRFFIGKSLKVPKGLLFFYFVPVITTIFTSFHSYFSLVDFLTVFVRIVFYFLLIITSVSKFDYRKSVKFYYILTMLVTGYLLVQVVGYRLFDFYSPIPFNFSEYLFGSPTKYTTQRYYSLYGFRPASIFVEPSHFAMYVTPLIAILLFSSEVCLKKQLKPSWRVISAIIVSLATLFSTSSLGLVITVIVWIIFVFSKSSDIHLNVYMKFVISIMILSGSILISQSSIFSDSISRFLSGASIGARLIRGFIIYGKMDPFEKIFGVGLNNVGNFVVSKSIVTPYDEADLNYTVTLTNRLIATGLCGTMSLLYFWMVNFVKSHKHITKVLAIIILISFIFANGEYTCHFAFLFILMYCSKNNNSLNND